MGIRVLVADDHEMVRAGLCSIINQQHDLEVIAETGDGASAVALVKSLSPDVIILDIAMPVLNGIEATRQILTHDPDAQIIMVSMHREQQIVCEALAAGASGYLPKNSTPHELLLAIRAVGAGKQYLGTRITRGLVTNCITQASIKSDTVFAKLSARQREVLQLLAEGKSNKEIASSLKVCAKTIEAHRAQIMEKLQIRTMAGLTKYAIREGITSLEA